jgi:dihydrofolate reductase
MGKIVKKSSSQEPLGQKSSNSHESFMEKYKSKFVKIMVHGGRVLLHLFIYRKNISKIFFSRATLLEKLKYT